MSDWITDRLPDNSHDVLVSVKWDEQARIGFYQVIESHGCKSSRWHVWTGEFRDQYDAKDVDGWMPIPKSVYALAQKSGGSA